MSVCIPRNGFQPADIARMLENKRGGVVLLDGFRGDLGRGKYYCGKLVMYRIWRVCFYRRVNKGGCDAIHKGTAVILGIADHDAEIYIERNPFTRKCARCADSGYYLIVGRGIKRCNCKSRRVKTKRI